MKLRITFAAALSLLLAGCATTGSPGNPVEARWLGKPAGAFFAKFGPPTGDVESGNTTVYSWRGGYKTVRIPAKYAESDGKKGKKLAPARTAYLSCSLKLTTGADYVIRDIAILGDRPGVSGTSWCAEFLAGDSAE